MKHLKLLGLLMAVLTTVFSYGQGRVSIRVNEGQSMTTIAAHVDASNPFGSNFMTGSGYVMGMARGTDSIHASTPAGSSFGLFDPTDPNGPAITTSMGGDGSLVINMPHEVTIAVDSMNNFYLGVIFMGYDNGTNAETVTLSAGGTVVGVSFTAYNADDSTQTVTPILSLTDVHTEMPCELANGLMMGTGYVIGMAQGIDTIHFQFPATSNFSLIDPNTAMGAPLANGVGEGGDGSMPNFLKNLDIDMATCSSAPYFYCPVVYYGPAGDFNEILSITAQGLEDAVSVAFHAYPMQEDTTQMGGDPYMYASTTQLVLTGANPETWRLASGTLTINAGNIDTLQLQMQSGRNIQIGDNSSFATLKTFYLNYAEQTTIDVLMLLNTVSPGVYTDVLTISAPGTNLRPIEVYISAVVEQQGGDSTQQTLSVGWEGSIDMSVEVGTWHDISIPVTYTNMNQQLVISTSYPFSIKDPMDAAGATYSSYVFYPSQTYGTSGTVYPDFRIIADQVGTYSGTIYFYLDEGVVDYTLTFTVNVYNQGGDSTHVDPGYFQPYENSLFLSCRLTSLQDSTFHVTTPAQFTAYNLDSLVVELASGAQYTLGNESTGQMGPRMVYTYQPYSKVSDMVKVIFTGVGVTEAGYYMDTLIYRPYDGNGAMQPIYVPLTTEVIDNTQPMFRLAQDQVSQSKEKDSPWYHCVVTASAYAENIHSLHFWLAQGTHFKLLDIRELNPGSLPETLDPMYQHTSIVYDSLVLTQSECYFYILQKVEEAGSFMDTLWIEAEGIDGIFPVLITGTVTDWSGGYMSWQSRNVTVTLSGDSLIFSGSGSTLDYSDYGSNIAPWREDITTHLSYDQMPKHVVVEPGVSRLGNYSLYGFEFQTIDFGQLDTLGSNLFTCCNHIEVLELPASIDYIDCYALQGVYPQKIINNLRPDVEMCWNPFEYMYPSSLVANTTLLLQISNPRGCLVVPANDTIRDIYVDYGYAYEAPLDGFDLVVDHPMALNEETIPAVQNPSVILYSNMFDTIMCGHLDVPVTTTLHMGKFVKKDFFGFQSPFALFEEEVQWGYAPSFSSGYHGVLSTLVNDGILSADTVMLYTKWYCGKWHFVGLPFNQKVNEIRAEEHQYYCIRRFDGAQQAAGEYDSVWVDIADNDTLRAGEGFILQTYTPTDVPADLYFTALDDAAKQNIFTPSVQSLPLKQYPSEMVWNANWNFVVNPYPCFYDTRVIGGNGIITVYDGNRGDYYRSYSIADDYYVLQPHEGFLYQAAAGENALRMPLEGRQHSARAAGITYQNPYDEWGEDRPVDAPARATRTLLNFYLEQNNNKDRARVVLNETASMDYEVGVDATKMFAPGSTAAQLYAQQGGAKQSILERPTGNGIVYLGVRLMESGDCTISVPETKGMDIMMLDTETNVMTNLSLTDYTFFGTPGENSGRFIIGLVGEATFLEYLSGNDQSVVKVIENGHVYILRGSDKFDVLGNKH